MTTDSTKTEPTKTIAILGANGRVSREVARAFHAAGWQVIAVTRNGKSDALANRAGIIFRAADAMKGEELIAATEGADVIFNGLNPTNYTDWGEEALPMARNVIAALKTHRAVHLFPGNVYNFGSNIAETVTPDTPFRPDHKKAKIRTQMEKLFADAAEKDDLQFILLRAGDFYGGDGKGSWFDLVLTSKLAKGKFTYPGDQNIPHAWAYVPDMAKVFVRLTEVAGALETVEVFHFESHNTTGEEFHAATKKALGRKLKLVSLPGFMIRIAGWFSPLMREVSEVFYQWNRPHSVKDPRLEEVIGGLPHTPLETAVRNALIGQKLLKDTSQAAQEK